MTIILGIDPGSRITGYGLIRVSGRQQSYVASGCIRMENLSVASRLHEIYKGISTIINHYLPHEVAVEKIFMYRNADSALKLGQARGAAIVATAVGGLPLAEYSARQVKQSVVGYGAANKNQVQQMVQRLLGLSGLPQSDAADALAVALCHANSRHLMTTLYSHEGTS